MDNFQGAAAVALEPVQQRGPGRPKGSTTANKTKVTKSRRKTSGNTPTVISAGDQNRPSDLAQQNDAQTAGVTTTNIAAPRKRNRSKARRKTLTGTQHRPAELQSTTQTTTRSGIFANQILGMACLSFSGDVWNPATESWNAFEQRSKQQFGQALNGYRDYLSMAHRPLVPQRVN